MEAQSISAAVDLPLRERLRETAPVRLAARYPQYTAAAVIALGILILIARHGLHDVAQTSLNGLTLGSVYALGAVGLTLVYGILKLTNFAHGDFLTFGAYMAFLVNVTWGGPLVLGIVFGMLATALMAVFLEKIMWGPMRARRAGLLQLLLMSIGLAFLLRYTIQFIWGTQVRALDVNVTDTVQFLGLRIGRTDLIVIVIGFVTLMAVGLMLKYTLLGKRMRALSDNFDLAETSGHRHVADRPVHVDLRGRPGRARRRVGRRGHQPPPGVRVRAAAAHLRRGDPGRHR